MKINYLKIGKQIKKHRKLKGLTQQKLADKIFVDTGHISKIENGKNNMSLTTFILIANALEVSSDVLLAENIAISNSKKNDKISQILLDSTEKERLILTRIILLIKEVL